MEKTALQNHMLSNTWQLKTPGYYRLVPLSVTVLKPRETFP